MWLVYNEYNSLESPSLFSFGKNQDDSTIINYQSKDQKASDTEEVTRIESLGGYVYYGRVNGTLCVPRAFGDFKGIYTYVFAF